MTRPLRLSIAAAALVALALLVAQLIEIPFRSALRGYDNTFNYLWLRSAMVDADWDFRNDLAVANTLVPEHRASALALPLTTAGRIPNKYGVGWAVLTAPAYLAADAVVTIGRMAGWRRLERDGFNPVYQIAVQLWHFGLALLALVLASRVVSRWVGDAAAAAAGVVAVWAASPLVYYQAANVSMSHGAAFFAIVVLAYATQRARETEPAQRTPAIGLWLLAGAAFGLAVVTRFQLAVFGIILVSACWEPPRRAPVERGRLGEPSLPQRFGSAVRSSEAVTAETAAPCPQRGVAVLRRIGFVAAGAAPFVLLQLWAWRVVYGEWLVFGYDTEGETFHWARPEWLNSLFSSWHGLVYWHPFLFVAAVGLFAWAWARRPEGLAWGLAVLATTYVNAAWWCWWFASAFGGRAYDAVLLPLMAGTGWLYRRAGDRARRVLAGAAIAAAAWNVYLVLLYRTGAIPRGDPVSWAEMLAAGFRLPEALRF